MHVYEFEGNADVMQQKNVLNTDVQHGVHAKAVFCFLSVTAITDARPYDTKISC
jgi:hypothetical protein